jgi:hypothetical protein
MPAPCVVVRSRLERALARRDLGAVRAAARDSPCVVTLADAIEVLLLIRSRRPGLRGQRDSLDHPLRRRMPRRHARQLHAALEAQNALPAPNADATLAELLKRHGVDRATRRQSTTDRIRRTPRQRRHAPSCRKTRPHHRRLRRWDAAPLPSRLTGAVWAEIPSRSRGAAQHPGSIVTLVWSKHHSRDGVQSRLQPF